MVTLELEKATDFKRIIEALAALITEAEFIVDENGLTLKATDPSQISMVDFSLPKSAFKNFDAKEKAKIGLDLTQMKEIMARSKASDSIALSLGEEKPILTITFKGNSTRNFSIPLLDVSAGDMPTPKIEFDAEVKLRAEVLLDAIKDASLISSHITLGVTASSFIARASSTKGTIDNETTKEEKSLLDLKANSECSSMFPIDYLQNMLKGCAADTELTLFLKSDAPIKMSYKVSGAELTYFLAPRIESQ